jgi:hypothetical protein
LVSVVTDNLGSRMRSPRAMALLWAAFAMSLALAAAFVVVNHTTGAPNTTAGSLTDEQAAAHVIDSAKQVVAVARLEQATGGYAFVSCANETDPPYQAVLNMSFHLPQANSVRYLRDVASAMIAGGWAEAPTMGEQFGQKLTRDGVTSEFHRNPDDRDFATMRLSGECGIASDHRADGPTWTEVGL